MILPRDLLRQCLNARDPFHEVCLSNEEKGEKKTPVALKAEQRLQLFKCIVVFYCMGIIDNDDRIFACIGTLDSLNLKCALQFPFDWSSRPIARAYPVEVLPAKDQVHS